MGNPKYLSSEQNFNKLGILGRFFGDRDHSSNNIIGIICLILTLGLLGIIFLIKDNKIEILKAYAPFLTLAYGYFIGSKK